MKKIFLIVLGALAFTNCEKDDICDATTATTPQLVVEFYEISNPTALKPVTDLQVTGEGGDGVLNIFSGVSKILLPLKTTENITKYKFVLNASNPNIKNEDEVEFNYSRKDQYISRACGFKTLFTLNPDIPLTEGSDGPWIQNTITVNPDVINENQTHVKIYF